MNKHSILRLTIMYCTKLLFTAGIILLLSTACEYYKNFGIEDDNIIEEIIECQIKNKTGFDIDLTPKTKEA